jgi:glycosyltransferase 2 family protein
MAAMAAALPIADQTATPAGSRVRIGRNVIYTAVWVAMGAAAVYFLTPQAGALAESIGALADANPLWLLAGLALVAARYAAAALSLAAAAGTSLPFVPTAMVQVATSFVGRLTPEGIGWLVLNQRYLEKAGLSRPFAAATLALRVAAGGVTRVAIVGVVAALVGREAFTALDLSIPWLMVVLGIAAAALLLGALGYALRNRAARITAAIRSAASAIGDALRSPRRAALLFGGSAATTLLYVLTLAVSLAAVDASVSFLPLFAMYLAATAVAAASPTPGNLGALELTLTGGLATLSVPTGTALGAVLVFRLLTFWLPLLPGFLAFRYLHRSGHL